MPEDPPPTWTGSPPDPLYEPNLIERCRRCGHPVGDWHDEWCKWYDAEPDHPDEWVEVDPEAIAKAEDSYHHSMIGEREP